MRGPHLRAQAVLDALKPYVDSAGKIAAPTRAEIFSKAVVTQLPSSSLGAPKL